ncbi:hypothetical protein P9112_014606 [Eukaryota sp. TZLM1-RC]
MLFWVTAWLTLNTGVTLLNKACFSFVHFNAPLLLTCVHLLFSWGLSSIYTRYANLKTHTISGKHKNLIILFSILFFLNISVGNSSLAAITVSLTQTIRATTPIFTIVLSILILAKSFNSQVYWSLPILFCGMVIAFFGESDFRLLPSLLAVLGVFLSALKCVVSNKFLVGELKVHPIVLLNTMAPWSLVFLFPLALIREFDSLSSIMTPLTLSFLVLSGTLAFCLNVANFFVNKATSPLTLTILGLVKQVVTILVSVAIFGNSVSSLNAFGIITTILGAVLYSLSK